MSRNRFSDYIKVRDAKKRIKRNVSSVATGKKAVYYTTGGKGTKLDQGIRCASAWNPGKVLPSKRYR